MWTRGFRRERLRRSTCECQGHRPCPDEHRGKWAQVGCARAQCTGAERAAAVSRPMQ